MMVELKPCRHCRAECRVETFGGGVHVTPTDLWLCSKHKMFDGDCPSGLSYFTADAWNEGNAILSTGDDAGRAGFAPCPLCKQYSHSIGGDKLAEAILHFETMYAHPLRGTPMGQMFDDKTRDMAHVLTARNKALEEALERIARHDVGLQGLIEDGEDTPEKVAEYYAMQIERRRKIARAALNHQDNRQKEGGDGA
jgi:hypothetical protein